MNVQVEKLDKSRVKIKFSVEKETVNKYINNAYEHLSVNVTIPGFRKGHAPRDMVEAQIGSHKIHDKALEMMFPFVYAEAITQEKIQSIGRPNVKVLKFAPDNQADFEVEVSVLPEVVLGNYKKLIIEKNKISVENKEIEAVLNNLRKRDSKLVAKEGSAESGDWVDVDFSGEKNGVKIEKMQSKAYPFVIGEGVMLPDFEKAVIGLSEGESKDFDLTFPKDYTDKEVAGGTYKFTVKVNKVQKVELPELDEEFIKKMSGGNESTLDGLKKDIKEALYKQKEQEDKIRIEEEILTQIVEKAEMQIPEDLLNEEFNEMKQDVVRKLEAQGLNLEKYLEFSRKSMEEYDLDLMKEAERKIKVGLVLNKIAEEEKIEVTEEEREAEVNKIKVTQASQNPGSEFKEDETRRYVTIVLKHRKTIDRLLEYATS